MDQAFLEKSFSPLSCTARFSSADEAYKAHYSLIETGKYKRINKINHKFSISNIVWQTIKCIFYPKHVARMVTHTIELLYFDPHFLFVCIFSWKIESKRVRETIQFETVRYGTAFPNETFDIYGIDLPKGIEYALCILSIICFPFFVGERRRILCETHSRTHFCMVKFQMHPFIFSSMEDIGKSWTYVKKWVRMVWLRWWRPALK